VRSDIRYHGSYLKGSHLWIIMEYCSGGSCSDLVCKRQRGRSTDHQLKAGIFKEEYIAILARELLKGLEYLHGEGKLHRDIKGVFGPIYSPLTMQLQTSC
jgi:serine/threonine-protein kinase 24/25/MST4